MANDGPLTGKSVRGYEFRELLGEGGFGAVYKAYQPSVQREVAVKVILPQHAETGEFDFIAGFETEARFIAQLEHVHIVPLYDFWRASEAEQALGSGAFIVMRLLRGGSLHDLISAGPLDMELAAKILDHVTSALHVAHRYGIVHRDLKPANILLDEEQNAYLSDFGIAKPIGFVEAEAGITGSLAYIAPEQLQSQPPRPQSDIYSLGYVLYEMLAGSHPFGRVSTNVMVYKHLTEPCPPLTIPNLEDQTDINDVIQRATAKHPDDRYVDTPSMAADFRRALSFSLSVDQPIFQVDYTQPDTTQLEMLQSRLDQLYRRLESLVDQREGVHDPRTQELFQQTITEVQVELQYRSSGLRQAEKHAALTLPPSLRPVPVPTHTLVGIAETRAQARTALLDGQSLTLLGASGAGKSVLAAELAADEEVRRIFNGNIVWLAMGKTPNLFDLIGAWLAAFGEDSEALGNLTSLEARLSRLQERVGDRRFLVIIDDLWKMADIQEALLNAPLPFAYIVTTRQAEIAASLLWKTVTVDALEMEDRLALLRSLLTNAAVSATISEGESGFEIRRLLERIGGLPRDLILLVTRLRRAETNAHRLRREIEKLTQYPTEVLEQGYASLKLSVDELSDAARRAFRALALFPAEPNSFSEEAGEAVCGDVDVLYELVDASLLEVLDARFALGPSFADYALQFVPFEDQAETTRRFVEHYCADVIGAGQHFEALQAEMRNLEAALQIAAADSTFRELMIDAVIALAPVWDARGMVAEGENYLQAALGALSDSDAGLRRAQLHLHLAVLYDKMGDLDRAETHTRDGLAALDGQADAMAESARIQLLRQQGILHRIRGRYDEAQALYTEALQKAEAARDYHGISRLHNSLGTLVISYKETPDPDAARDHFLRSIEAARQADNAAALAVALQNLGLLESTEAHDRAEKYLSESIILARQSGNHAQISATLQSMGSLERERGHVDKALVHFDEALHHSRLAHDNESIGWALLQLANVAVETGDFGRAEAALDESFALAHKRGDPFLCDQVAIVVLKLGETRITAGAIDSAAKVWSRLREDGVGGAAELSEERRTALRDVHSRLTGREAQSTDAARAAAYLNLGLLELNEYGDSERARKHFEAAQAAASAANDLTLANRARAELANLSPD